MKISIKQLFVLTTVCLGLAPHAQAETLDKQTLGLRYSDNVYMTPEGRTSDFYLLLNSRYNFYPGESLLGLRLDLADYAKTQDNDYVGIILSNRWSQYWRAADLNLKLFHKNYFNGNAATSDSSFTHTGLGMTLEKEWTPRSSMLVLGSTGYETRFFHDFGGRNDHQLMVATDIEFNSNPKITPYTYADMGFVISSQAAYSTMFVDLGGGAKGPITGSLLWVADLDIRSVNYVNRTVNQTLEITKRRGNVQTVDVTDTERTSSVTVGGGTRWNIDRNFELENRLNITSQSSNNPNFAYENTEFYISLVYKP